VPVEVPEMDLSFSIPDGFREMPGQTNDAADIARFYGYGGGEGGEPETRLTIQRLREPASAGEPSPSGSNLPPVAAPPGLDYQRFYTERWRDFDISVLSRRVTTGRTSRLERTVRLPLRPRSVQVRLESRHLNEEEMSRMLRELLASMENRGPAPPPGGEAALVPDWARALLYVGLAVVVIAVGLLGIGRGG
jgi:hypothetical protein